MDENEIKEQTKGTIRKIKETVKEEDPKLSSTLTLRTILGGDFLTAEMVRHQIWLCLMQNTRLCRVRVLSRRNAVKVMC